MQVNIRNLQNNFSPICPFWTRKHQCHTKRIGRTRPLNTESIIYLGNLQPFLISILYQICLIALALRQTTKELKPPFLSSSFRLDGRRERRKLLPHRKTSSVSGRSGMSIQRRNCQIENVPEIIKQVSSSNKTVSFVF